MIRLKNYIIFSKNNILETALSDNSDYRFVNYHNLKIKDKFDILIIDDSDFGGIPLFRANIIINLTGKKLHKNEFVLNKPYNLADLIAIIDKNAQDQEVFCTINSETLYSQRKSVLLSENESIQLTDKENSILSAIFLRENLSIDKARLREDIWGYHENTESSTVETHIYKLKNKLPKGVLEIKGDQYTIKSARQN